MPKLLIVCLSAMIAGLPGSLAAKDQPKKGSAPNPTCSVIADSDCRVPERRNAVPGARSQMLTTPVRDADVVSITGKSDFGANRYGSQQFFNNTAPNQRTQDISGGGSMNFKF